MKNMFNKTPLPPGPKKKVLFMIGDDPTKQTGFARSCATWLPGGRTEKMGVQVKVKE